jgi:predicted TIM-barrel fold metal-dependent hydrolase
VTPTNRWSRKSASCSIEDRVLYGMDYPYQYSVEEVIALDNMNMAPAVKKKFFQTNAEHLFKFKAE